MRLLTSSDLPKSWQTSGVVELWYFRYEPSAKALDLSHFVDLLPADEIDYAQDCAPARRVEFLSARASLRFLLSKYFPEVEPIDWRFSKNEFGKPEVASPIIPKEFKFNVSHSTGLVVIAFCSDGDSLGVDIEEIHRAGDLEMIAESHFAPSEIRELKTHLAENFRARFFHYWTLKEAFIKAVGSGLSLPLDQFSMRIGESAPVTSTTRIQVEVAPTLNQVGASWRFALLQPNLNHQVAVAVQGTDANELYVQDKGYLDLEQMQKRSA